MRGHADEIERALTTLSGSVADRLSAVGWKRRWLDGDPTHATLTRPAQNGITAVVEIRRTSFHWPDDWPIEVTISLGVGYEPALNLMPLLTMSSRAALIVDSEQEPPNRFGVQLTGPDSVQQAAERIVQFASERAAATVEPFPDAAAIEEYRRHEDETTQTPTEEDTEIEDGDPGVFDFDTEFTQDRLVLLAAMGRLEEARAGLATYVAEQTDRAIDRDDRRFIRQLTRWLDAGGPVAPPIEETLARLPQRTRPPRPSWSNARAESKAKKEALDAVRSKSRGKTLDQLIELITAEYSARGIEIAPSMVDFYAEMLQAEQQPFGRVRTALKGIRMLKSAGGEIIRQIKHSSDGDPEWLLPPDRAAFPMIADRNRYTPVQLDAAARDLLERVRTEGPRRVGPWVLIDVWLAREVPAGALIASIGAQRVGTIPQSQANEFDHALRAASLFDEDPVVRGRLTAADGTGAIALEIPLPESQGVDTPT
jgi:hypothetical protein